LTLVLILILVAGYYLLTRSFLTRLVVMGQVSRLTGGDATASSVLVDPDGRVTIHDAKLRVAGVVGEAGTIVSVRRLDADFDMSSLLTGKVVVRSVVLDEPIARISQSVDDGSVNVARINPPTLRPTKGPKVVPRIIVRSGVIELGEHVTDPARLGAGEPAYTSLKRIDVAGEVQQSPDESGAKIISFRQYADPQGIHPVPGGLTVSGRVAPDGITITLEGLALGTWSPESAPARSRELFRQTALEGEVSRAVMVYSYTGGWEARIALADVAMNLPIKARPDETIDGDEVPLTPEQANRLLRIQRVNGEVIFSDTGVRGRLKGLVEELPYEVNFRVDGTSKDSAFTCHFVSRGFKLEQKPEIVYFAPGVARRRLEQFGDPTGIVDAEVTIFRGPPVDGKEADVQVDGKLWFREVTAAFAKFPYRFHNMTGEVTFDDKRIVLKHIEGDSPSGARVVCTGTIAPPTSTAAVDLDIRVTNLPMDAELAQAMRQRKRVIEALFSAERYQALLAAGLIATPGQHDGAVAGVAAMEAAGRTDGPEYEAIQALAARPVFELGGRAEVHVAIQRRYSVESHWTDTVTIRLARAGVLPERVPYPMIVENLTIIKEDALATVQGGVYRGLRGGEAVITARADFDKLDNPDIPFVPDITVSARAIPVDELLIFSLPELGGDDDAPSGDRSLHAMLSALHATGTIRCEATVGLSPEHETGYDVVVHADGMTAAPLAPDQSSRTTMTNARGTIRVDQNGLRVALTAEVGHAGPTGAPAGAERTPSSPATIEASMRFAKRGDGSTHTQDLSVQAASPDLDVTVPVEDLVRVFAPEAASAVENLRAAHAPTGRAALRADVRRADSASPAVVVVDASGAHAIEFSVAGGRIGVAESRGAVRVKPGIEGSAGEVTFTDFSAPIAYGGEPGGDVRVNGSIRTDGSPIAGGEALNLGLEGGHLGSGLTRTALARFGPRSIHGFVEGSNARGLFDLTLTLATHGEDRRDGPALGGGAEPGTALRWDVRGVFSPRSLEVVRAGVPIVFPSASGRIEFSGTDGRLRDLVLNAPGWTARAHGGWQGAPGPPSDESMGSPMSLQAEFALDAAGLSPDLAAALPEQVRSIFADLKLEVHGPMTLRDAALAMSVSGAGDVTALKTSGSVNLEGAGMDVGLAVTRAGGAVDYTFTRVGLDAQTEFELWSLLDEVTVSGVTMTQGRVRMANGIDGEILIPHLSANAHGGRIAGTARLGPPAKDGEKGRTYEVEVSASDVRFASLLADFERRPESPIDPGFVGPLDESRGLLDAGVAFGGTANDPGSRRGQGSVTIGGGRVLNLPLLVPLVRVSNLQLPIDERLDFARAEFFVRGPGVHFEELSVSSRSVGLYGYGTATLPDLELDLRFKSRSRNRIPLLTGILERLRDELLGITVVGTLREPRISVATLTGTTRFLGKVIGAGDTEQGRLLDQIEEQAKRDAKRFRPGEDRVPPARPN